MFDSGYKRMTIFTLVILLSKNKFVTNSTYKRVSVFCSVMVACGKLG
jgi:hypothetical protein